MKHDRRSFPPTIIADNFRTVFGILTLPTLLASNRDIWSFIKFENVLAMLSMLNLPATVGEPKQGSFMLLPHMTKLTVFAC